MVLQGVSSLDGTHNAARKVLDGINYLADTISSVSYGPSKVLGEWTADQINPAYWVPNAEIIVSFHIIVLQLKDIYYIVSINLLATRVS